MSIGQKDPLLVIPGVGSRIAEDLREIGIEQPADLRGKDPEKLYIRLCKKKNAHVDRCMLYVFRCAVYYASSQRHDPELLKWWNWKDR